MPPSAILLAMFLLPAAVPSAADAASFDDGTSQEARSGLRLPFTAPVDANTQPADAAQQEPIHGITAKPASVGIKSIPLAQPNRSSQSPESAQQPRGLPSLVGAGSSLAIVLGLFLVVAWLMRRTAPGQCPLLPKEVLQTLGRVPLTARQQAYLIRLGNKLVLLSIAPDGVEALCEVTDPAEVDRLMGLCSQSKPNSSTVAFRQVLNKLTANNRGEDSDD